jgi:pilus assembly protein CpaC
MMYRKGFAGNGSLRIGLWGIAAAVMCSCWCWCWCGAAAGAQPPTGDVSSSIEVVVHGVDRMQKPVTLASDRPVRLAVGKSVIVELVEKGKTEPIPIIRASVGIKEVAEAVVATPKQVLVTGRGEGATGLILWAEDGRHRMVDIEVTAAAFGDVGRDLEEEIHREFPTSRVNARFVRDTVVLTGMAPTAEVAKQIVDLAEVFATKAAMPQGSAGGGGSQGGAGAAASTGGGAVSKVRDHMQIAGEQQVLLRCTVAEVSKTAIRRLGINGWLAGDNIRDMFVVNQIGGINPANIGAAPAANIIQPGGLLFDTPGIPLQQTSTLSIGFPRVQMQLFFQALRENDLLRVLAEPNLVAIAGQEAQFLVGGEIPVPVPQSSAGGGVTITIEWKKFGIQLRFAATPMGRDKIRLRVAPVVSDLDPTNGVQIQGFFIPAIRERRAETMVELANGSTIAIAGLLRDSSRGVTQKVPAVGDIPVLGALFSSVQYQRDQTELVILVTPELARAMNPDQVAPVPGQFMTEPNDWQLFGLGLLEGEPDPDPDARELAVKTDVPVRNRKWTAPPTQMSLHGPWGAADDAETR